MTLLPVAHRELLAASRRKATFRIRIGSALLAAGMAFLMLLYISLSGSGPRTGQFVFYSLVLAGHFFALGAGLFLTVDCISEERREGTLGFLFLTDLAGSDIIAGKLVGSMLGALYGLTAVFPVLSISWFIGGISNGEFWRNCIALLNELFVAAAIGIAMSARESRSGRAAAKAVFIAGFGVIGMPCLMELGGTLLPHPAWGHVANLSPANLLGHVRDAEYLPQPRMFFLNLGLSHLLGWVLLAYATIAVHRGWRQDSLQAEAPGDRHRLARASVDINPAQALIGGATWAARTALLVALCAVVGALLFASMRRPFLFTSGLLVLAGVGVRGLMVWDITQFIGEARRTGTLELLLTTPIQDDHLSRAVHAHLLRQFSLPVALLLLAELGIGLVTGNAAGIVPNMAGTFIQLLAIGSVSIWFSLTEAKPMVAFLRAFGLVVALATPLNYLCCIGLALPAYLAAWAQTRLRLPYREILCGVRSHWQRRDGWLYPTTPPARRPAQPPPLPYRRE